MWYGIINRQISKVNVMPKKSTVERAKQDLREGKSPSTAAGEFVREEIEHVRQGEHGVRSPKQAIAIGLSEARRAGIPLKPPAAGSAKASTRKSAQRDYRKGQTTPGSKPSRRRSRSSEKALEREPRNTVSHEALAKQARSVAQRRKRGTGKRTGAASTGSARSTPRKAA